MSKIGPKVGHNRQECSFNPELTQGYECGAPAIYHSAITENDEAVVRFDAEDGILNFDHPDVTVVFSCNDHITYLIEKFYGRRATHEIAGHPCGHPDARWGDEGCVFPPDVGLTVEVAEELTVDV